MLIWPPLLCSFAHFQLTISVGVSAWLRMEGKWDLLSTLLCTKYCINLQLGTTLGFISISKTVHDRDAETINSESFPTARPRHQHGVGHGTGQVLVF